MVMVANYSIKAGTLILGVAGAAAGLNMSVLALQPGVASQEAAPVVVSGDPEVIQVEVDIPIPAAQAMADQSVTSGAPDEAAGTIAGPAMTAAPAPAAPRGEPASAPADPPPTAPVPVPATPPPTSPESTSPVPTSPAPAPTSPAPTNPSTTATTEPVPITEYLTYSFEGVASIVVALHDGNRLEFWSVNAQGGWAYRVEKDDGRTVKIKFENESGGEEEEAVFEVKFEDGALRVKRER